MAAIIVGVFTIGCLTLAQGIYVLRSGNAPGHWFMRPRPQESSPKIGFLPRLGRASVLLAMSIAIFSILIAKFVSYGKAAVVGWLLSHLSAFFVPLTFFLFGLFNLLRPEIMVKWVKDANPGRDVSDQEKYMVLITRTIGFAMMVSCLLILGRFTN